MNDIQESADKLKDELIDIRRRIHRKAECGFDLPETTKLVMDKLTRMGYEPEEITKSGVSVLVGGKKPGKTILLRADMDALPVSEETLLDFQSKNSNMHACGHDMHTAMLLGTAKVLKKMENEIEGTIKLMFQPAEELLSGAPKMIEAGILKNPDVDAAIMLHVFSGFPEKAGNVGFFQSGPCMASHDKFEIFIKGVGCHGAWANTGIDPLITMSNIHLAIQEINSREIPPGDFLIITVGQLVGGTVANVIPDSAFMTGTIRAYKKEIRELAKKRLEEIAEGIGKAYRTEVEVRYSNECPVFNNNEILVGLTKRYITDLFSEENIVEMDTYGFGQNPGSEDFAFVSKEVPSTIIAVFAGFGEVKDYPMHHPKVTFDESVLTRGAAIYAHCAVEWLKEHK